MKNQKDKKLGYFQVVGIIIVGLCGWIVFGGAIVITLIYTGYIFGLGLNSLFQFLIDNVF